MLPVRQIREIEPGTQSTSADDEPLPVRVPLLEFTDEATASTACIPFTLRDYIALVDWSGRARREDKHGAIDEHLPPIARRLNIDAQAWHRALQPGGNTFGRAFGQLDHLRLHAKTLGQAWVRGLWQAQQMYRTG